MPKRPRHIDLDLVRAMNPEGEDLLAAAAPSGRPPDAEVYALPERQAMAALEAIGAFNLEHPRERQPADEGQALDRAEALLQAMALLLKKDTERLRRTLEEVARGDRSEAALAEARGALGILNRKTLKELLEGVDPGTIEALRLEAGEQEGISPEARNAPGIRARKARKLLPPGAVSRRESTAGQTGIQEPQWVAETKARFPRLFRGLGGDPYGFACGEGWREIVTGLCEDLEAMGRPRLKIVQIKEKFGSLRVYVEGGNKATVAMIQEAEAASSAVCEWCGAPGARTSDGRLLTLCLACQAKGKRKRVAR